MTELPKQPAAVNTRDSSFAYYRFLASLISLVILAVADLIIKGETIPTIVYMMIGGLNGVDAYKLYREIQK